MNQLHLVSRATHGARRLGVLPGSFNPPTRAHLALAEAALAHVDEVVFVLPRVLPHKEFDTATFHDRIEMLRLCLASEPRFSIGSSEGGLFVDIAAEIREHYPSGELLFVCGRDAAERIINWDYGRPGAVDRMLADFSLLVAQRTGTYEPPDRLRSRVRTLHVNGFDEFSSTLVREGVPHWRELVPEEIHALVERIYRGEREF